MAEDDAPIIDSGLNVKSAKSVVKTVASGRWVRGLPLIGPALATIFAADEMYEAYQTGDAKKVAVAGGNVVGSLGGGIAGVEGGALVGGMIGGGIGALFGGVGAVPGAAIGATIGGIVGGFGGAWGGGWLGRKAVAAVVGAPAETDSSHQPTQSAVVPASAPANTPQTTSATPEQATSNIGAANGGEAHFAWGSAQISSADEAKLREAFHQQFVQAKGHGLSRLKADFVGSADGTGTLDVNQRLEAQRAAEIQKIAEQEAEKSGVKLESHTTLQSMEGVAAVKDAKRRFALATFAT
jgi:hypothetical protein